MMPSAERRRRRRRRPAWRQERETVVCSACFVCAFSFVACMYVQLRVENSAGSCKCTARTMCFNSFHIFIYAIRFSIFYRDCLFLRLGIRRTHGGSLFREREGEKVGGLKEQGEIDKRWKTAAGKQVSSTERDDRYTLPYHPTRVTRGNKRSYIL